MRRPLLLLLSELLLRPAPSLARRTLYAIGDLHGNTTMALAALKLTNTVCERRTTTRIHHTSLEWCGGNAVVVQMGDQIVTASHHRDQTIPLLFNQLASSAKASGDGGRVYSLIGNHEGE